MALSTNPDAAMVWQHCDVSDADMHRLIAAGHIRFGGNRPARIYGLLQCRSGKRMRRENRVFFASEAAAVAAGYRPCGHCMPAAYAEWKARQTDA